MMNGIKEAVIISVQWVRLSACVLKIILPKLVVTTRYWRTIEIITA